MFARRYGRSAAVLLTGVLGLAFVTACAAEVEIVLQDGLDAYAGTADVLLYSTGSVANVNYGDFPSFATGINRWNEQQAAIVAFDLSDVPPAIRVRSAHVALTAAGGIYPYHDLRVELHELTQDNAGWIEGDGDGTRAPTPKAPSWSFLSYDDRRWAGMPGASEPGVDYSLDWTASATVAARSSDEILFELPAEVVQRWIERPETNAGLRLWPEPAASPGDMVTFRSSEYQCVDERPRLVLTVADDEAALERFAAQRADEVLAVARGELEQARAEMSRLGLPGSTSRRLAQLETSLERTGAERTGGREALERARDLLDNQRVALAVLSRSLAVERGREFAQLRGGPGEFALAVQWPMVKVFREARLLDARFDDTAAVRLAGNEHEGVQVIVVPLRTDLRNVTWEVRGLATPGLSVSVAPVGYVRERQPAYADVRPDTAWWPDPLLDYLTVLDEVPRGEVRPLWVNVHAETGTPAGIHQADLVVRAEGVGERTVRLHIEVFDFSLPVEQSLRTVWGMSEGFFSRFYEDRYDEDFAWRFFDMFLDHRMAVGNLYRSHPTGEAPEDQVSHLASADALRRLRERGSGWWTVGYVMAPQWALNREPWDGMDWEQYLEAYVEMLRPEVQRMRDADWPMDRAAVYFLDETDDFDTLGRAVEVMRAAFPDIPLMTTGYDRGYGLDDSAVSRHLDIWVPLTPVYHEDRAKIEQGRELGKQAWWYVCVVPRDPGALNWLLQYPAIRSRLLMGAAARKYDVDGFLYYRVAGWTSNDSPITGGPITDWNPVYRDNLPDGDGQLICAGPNGPLSTVRLENIRDGIEDYEYWQVLDQRVAAGGAPAAARAAQEVPNELLTSIHLYSEDPEILEAVRLGVARAIEALQ
ncbi:MAG: glycoside hydrolase domain-containing protein [Armatimonadota bacterium]|jgi:hypothetical protein